MQNICKYFPAYMLLILLSNLIGAENVINKNDAIDVNAPSQNDRISEWTCGANCIFALYCVMGDPSQKIEEIAKNCNIDRLRGINFLCMKEYLIKNKFRTKALKLDSNEFTSDYYYILPVRINGAEKYNHYILILKINDNLVTYYDGKSRVKEFTVSDLEKIWDGECLRIAKNLEEPKLDSMDLEWVLVDGRCPFYVSKQRVTSEQYSHFISDISGENDKHTYCRERGCSRNNTPQKNKVLQHEKDGSVNGVSWFDGYAFCKWLGPEYQLPTKEQYLQMVEYNKKISGLSTALLNNSSKDKSGIDNGTYISIDGLFSDTKELMLNDYTTNVENIQRFSAFREVLLFDATGPDDSSPFGFCRDDETSDKIGFRVVKTR